MSGIAGIWNLDGRPVERAEIARLSDTLRHRGDDDEGFHLRGAMGLACRLSRITPESRVENQPMVDALGGAIVFDGRLDNRDELLAALPPAAALAEDAPDSALALATYRAHGVAFPERLNGDFALAVFDPDRRQILLSRDAIGLRPLYYYGNPAVFLFASEIKALLSHPSVVSLPADDVLADFLFNRLSGEDRRGVTFFQNIFSVLPAHTVLVTADMVRTMRYWDFDLSRQLRFGSFGEYADGFRHYFTQAIRRRLRSAGPVAVSVSGGLDSSAIFCTAERLRRNAEGCHAPLIGVSGIGPAGSAADESGFLAEVERHSDVKIHRLENLPGGLLEDCEKAVWHIEAPFMDTQWNRMHRFMSATRQLGARALLTGVWGDQFLFDDAYLIDLCRRGDLLKVRRHLREYNKWLDISDRLFFRKRLVRGLIRSALPRQVISAVRSLRGERRTGRALTPWYTAQFRDRSSEARYAHAILPRSRTVHAGSLYREARSRYHVLCMEWNNKVGAMHGLDVACPFLDRDLLAFLIATPGEMQSFMGIPKGILREGLRGVLPDKIAQRTSKADFTEVANEGVLRDYDGIEAKLRRSGRAIARGYVAPDVAAHLARSRSGIRGDRSTASWALTDLLALELWLQVFFDGRAA